jgi:hypothetical protein
MRRIITGLAASADSPGCVTKAEYSKISRYDTTARAHRVFDTKGVVRSQGYGMQVRTYDVCRSDYGMVTVTHERWNGTFYVERRSAYWG